MAREQLGELYGKRLRFTATFERTGTKHAYRGCGTLGGGLDETVLFSQVTLGGRVVSDHLWFTMSGELDWLDLHKGDIVSVDARVDHYMKGYERDSYDYKLSRPTKGWNHTQWGERPTKPKPKRKPRS
jgi:hypothetical protein